MKPVVSLSRANGNDASSWDHLIKGILSYQKEPTQTITEEKLGTLCIVGSGLAQTDFTREVEREAFEADHVFYCVYDIITKAWIASVRPDAMDLTLLYRPNLDRFYTYVQMSEVLLYHVRLGKKVLAIYYGHPGIFATPAHRAIQIAKREGYFAQMRPGISALDYLVAQVGFDPSIPGLLSYEATDMLLRERPIDNSLHVVIWQVGVVGEFGYSPEGFKNKGFNMLLDALEAVYGPNWPIVHYIASSFASVEPVIERFFISELRQSSVGARVGQLSTFYIEPQRAVATSSHKSVALGLTRPEQPVPAPERAFINNQYGPLEAHAIEELSNFAVRTGYIQPAMTPVVKFLIALGENPTLRDRFRTDPHSTLADERFADLTHRAKRLLAIPHITAVDVALAEDRRQS